MNLIELEKQIEKNKVISAFKDGVVDGLMHGMRDETKSHHYYNLGYDFGVDLYSRQIDEEEK
jgi:hypothetical protein|tara:strand:+ start:268 stop:453 length:186 start_codon:yes stop_codon:yes gene_type:complete